MGAVQRGRSWVNVPKTLKRARTMRAPGDNSPWQTSERSHPPSRPEAGRGFKPQAALENKTRDAVEGDGPQRRPQRRFDRRLEEVAKAVGGSYRRFQMPLRLALGVRGTVAGDRLGALEGGGASPPSNASLVMGDHLI